MLKKRQDSFSAKILFVGLVTVMLLMIGGVKMKPRPPVRQLKVDQILVYVKNQEKEVKAIKHM